MIQIDYKGGKVVWNSSYNWERDNYDYEQDILQVKYGENCVIDVGNYSDGKGGRNFVIMIIDYRPYPNENDKTAAWSFPYAIIPCADKADMLVQLQRAIDVYPKLIG